MGGWVEVGVGGGGVVNREETFLGDGSIINLILEMVSWSCVYVRLTEVHILNMCGLLYVNYTFIKLLIYIYIYIYAIRESKENDAFMWGGNKREICTVGTSFAAWPLNSREVIVRSVYQCVFIEQGTLGELEVCVRHELSRVWQWDPFRKSLSFVVSWVDIDLNPGSLTSQAETFEFP